jgi:uncharacterized protein YbjT (DUF2867 family)
LLVYPGLELVSADIHDSDVLQTLLTGCDTAINLVGILDERAHDGSGFRRVHVELVEKLVRACQITGVSRLIHVSALKANADRGPSHYLQTKGQAEQVIRRQCGQAIQFTILRPSAIFGPGDLFLNRFASLLRMTPVLPLACPRATFSPVYVDDVAAAIRRCLSDSATYGRVYELCGPETFTLKQLVELTRQCIQRRRWIIGLPNFLGRTQAFICEYFVPGKPFSLDNFRSLAMPSVGSTDGLRSLGITPRSLRSIAPTYLGRSRAMDTSRRSALSS